VADIFELNDLPSWLQVPTVDTETATRVRRYANGWLMSATGLSSWPDPIPDDLWAWAIELAGIAYRNPTALSQETTGSYSFSQDRAAKEAILAAAKNKYGAASSPQYNFPDWDWQWVAIEPTNALTD
jgi:hypothetical protein